MKTSSYPRFRCSSPPVVLDDIPQDGALRMPEDETRADVLVHAEEVEFRTEDAVVALFDLFEPRETLFEEFFVGEGNTVNPLEHPVVLVTPPVCARGAEEFERLDFTRRGNVGTAAEIGESPEPVQAHRIVGDIPGEFDLVGFTLSAEEFDRFLTIQIGTEEGLVLADNGFHLFLDPGEVFLGEGFLHVEVIVETVIDGRPRWQPSHRGNRRLTAAAITCAVECQYNLRPSSSSKVRKVTALSP